MYWVSYAPRGNRGMGAGAVFLGPIDLAVDTQFLVQAADTALATFKSSIGK